MDELSSLQEFGQLKIFNGISIQYLKAGLEHTKKDKKIDQRDHEEIQRAVNGHMRWWGATGCHFIRGFLRVTTKVRDT